tara:strand:+ start:114 stop:440 length:327 start_codon:yes stop_codon:yes gene_type:complete
MGWWPLDLKTGGIAFGAEGLKEGLMWGDTVADIVDEELTTFLNSVIKRTGKVFTEEIGRDMMPIEILCGLAFSLNACETHDPLDKLFPEGLTPAHTLKVEVGQVEVLE